MKADNMAKLAEANISTQLDLFNGLTKNLSRMLNLVRYEVGKAFNVLDKKKKIDYSIKEGDKTSVYATIELTRSEYDEMYSALRELRDGGYFNGLSSSAQFKQEQYDHDSALEMLKKLQA